MLRKWISPKVRELSPIYQYPDAPPRSTALVSMLGVAQADVDAMVVSGSAKLSRRFERTIYLVTADDFSAFRQRGLIVEYFPATAWGEPLTWRQYLLRRQEIILAKWQPDWILSYGQAFEAYLKSVEIEPFLG